MPADRLPSPPLAPPPLQAGVSAENAARLSAALCAVQLAAQETLRWFNASALIVTAKSDQSPVTQADHGAEAILRRELLRAFPQDSFLGEESGSVQGNSGYQWIVDPIDGTKSFIRGVPLYATLVGCRCEGQGVLGVIALPALEKLVYAAANGGAWYSSGNQAPVPARVSTRTTLSQSLLCTSDFTSFSRRRADKSSTPDGQDGGKAGAAVRQRLEEACLVSRSWGDGYGYFLVATGHAEVMIDPLMNAWDAAAVETVITEAGGRFSDWQGRGRIDSGEGLATNSLVHEEVLQLLHESG